MTNDPDHSPAPRFVLSGCSSGNVYGVRADVADHIATQLMDLAASEPPFLKSCAAPSRWDRYIEVLARDGPVRRRRLGTTCVLPNDITYRHDVRLVASDSVDGQGLRDALAAQGIPAGLAEMGFADVSAFWEPWCAAVQDGEVASLAFAARLSATGAEIGLATAPGLRGRGYAAAATAGWGRMSALRNRALFYSTEQTNISSQRVAARLGLRSLGASLVLY